jgi:hypothetical protein
MCEHQNLTAVIAALLALAGTLGTGIIVWVVDRRQQRLNLVSAFAGELRAILTVVEERQVLQALQRVVDDIQRLHQPRFIPFWIGDMHDVVFRQNADKLGSLRAPLPEQIVAAYYRIGSVVLELQMLFEASQGRGAWLGEQWRTDWQACLQQHQHTLALATKHVGSLRTS